MLILFLNHPSPELHIRIDHVDSAVVLFSGQWQWSLTKKCSMGPCWFQSGLTLTRCDGHWQNEIEMGSLSITGYFTDPLTTVGARPWRPRTQEHRTSHGVGRVAPEPDQDKWLATGTIFASGSHGRILLGKSGESLALTKELINF